MKTTDTTHLQVRIANCKADRLSAERLRYEVFIEELGADGPLVDHENRFERDEFDDVADHLVLVNTRSDTASLKHVVGVYRLLRSDQAEHFGRFYCDGEYDLGPLRASGRRLLELGRSCVHPDYRGGAAMLILWNALAEYVLDHQIEVLFGVASFHGTDIEALKLPLSWLHHNHLAPLAIRPRSRHFQSMDLVSPDILDRRTAMAEMPTLIKAYLRLGGHVGEGAFVDTAFNTTDVCLLMDTAAMSEKHKEFYVRKHEARE